LRDIFSVLCCHAPGVHKGRADSQHTAMPASTQQPWPQPQRQHQQWSTCRQLCVNCCRMHLACTRAARVDTAHGTQHCMCVAEIAPTTAAALLASRGSKVQLPIAFKDL
jgi:hypothetical protein